MTIAYPELPALPYRRTSVPMSDVIAWLQDALMPTEVKRATYIVFRVESANGQSGVNNNYSGMQADGARWPASIDHYFVGTTTAIENTSLYHRIFLCFASWQDSVACLSERLTARGIFVGGKTSHITNLDVTDATVLARVYTKEWVTGSAGAEPSHAAVASFLSMYEQAASFFQPDAAPAPTPRALPLPPLAFDGAAEIARLRATLTQIIAEAQAALDELPPPIAPAPDDPSDDLNSAELERIRKD